MIKDPPSTSSTTLSNFFFVLIYHLRKVQGLERQRLIVLTGAGFNHALSTRKASACCVEARRDDFIKGICSQGSLVTNHGRLQLNSAALMLHSYQMEMSYSTLQILQSGKCYLIFFNEHRKKVYLHQKFLRKFSLSHPCIGSDLLL